MDAVVQQVLETEHGLKLVRRIGGGGFAEVWEARTSQDVPCAVKVSLRPLDGETAQIQKELQTLELLKGLGGHPHVVSLMDVWQIGGYLVTRWELAPDEKARSLEDLLQYYQAEGKRGIPLKELLRYIYDAAQGIDFLNNQGIVHRDIKPGNLLLFWGRVKVGDLGLAKFVGASTASHTGAGTWGYLPPEAYQGRIGPAVDLYSLAATYVRLRTGREPFGTDPVEILDRQRAGQPILDGLSQAEVPVVLEALAPRPEDRPQKGACDWVRRLYRALQGPRVGSGQPGPPPPLQTQPQAEPASLPEKIVRAWEDTGAQVGWMGRTRFGLSAFGATQEEVLQELQELSDFLKPEEVQFLPVFRFSYWQEGLIWTLPEPTVPFGMDLSTSGITDTGLQDLAGLKNLQVLVLRGTQITDAGMVHLAGLKNLQGLDLSHTQITGARLKKLARLTNLQELDLQGTEITDGGLEKLAGLKNLQRLDLGLTKITDAGLEHLYEMKNLQWLSLLGTEITDVALVHLMGMKNLQVLNLWSTLITDAGLEKLRKALPGCEIVK